MAAGSALAGRMKRLKEAMRKERLQGAVLVPGPNLKYLTGVDSLMLERPFMLLVPAEGVPHLVAPKLEAGPYGDAQLPVRVLAWTDSEGPGAAVREAVAGAGLEGEWGVEGRAPYQYIAKLMEEASPKFRSAEPVLQEMREVKDQAEVALLKRSAAILSRAFEEFPGHIQEGRTEQELAREMTEVIYAKGATKVDDVLVQAGPAAADPHHLPSKRKLARGESLLVDVGAAYGGYYADITRTFCLGRSNELARVYDRVLEAQESAIDAAAEGTPVGKVDSAARRVLAEAGLGRYFFHRTGHGLGLEIHEAPYIVEGGKEKLREGVCFTVEPGAYIRGKFGVRIEDDVLIRGGRGAPITDAPKQYGWWR
ncbi:MAG: aminopeptidase P family protein [Nitrososphaerota archaeon]|nr:aminopeptidase P family protein [Nitrososphaerota archaeon]MDG6974866.1 aminopeptidase P family protein [Nitrososphaerota archaeon]MDG7009798.1 aminopeptidase P family protein [Nitrososphaerota archaeon]MDG7019261.1 aminopeptidase P family protein [Nitrososphaerota archaeon]